MSKRIIRDYETLSKNDEFTLFFDEKDMTKCKVLFFGPDDTPYHLGIYICDFSLQNYPQEPPKVSFTTGSIINARIHPNLYREGKVCLSILGTWGTYEWSPLLTLEKICLTIKALMDENPIRNEPGYETRKLSDKDASNYVTNVKYLCLKTITESLKCISSLPVNFQEKIREHISKNKETIKKYKEELLPHNKKSYPTLHHTTNLDVSSIHFE